MIRLARPDDAGAVRDIYAPAVTGSAVSFEIEVPGIETIRARILATLPQHPWLVADNGDRVLGYAYAGPFSARAAYRWSVETSVYVDAAAHRRGVGRSLYRSLLDVLALQGYQQAFGGIALPNPASVALHQRLGFTPAGTFRRVGWKLGAWHDVGWWQRAVGAGVAQRPDGPLACDQLPVAELNGALEVGTGPAAVRDSP